MLRLAVSFALLWGPSVPAPEVPAPMGEEVEVEPALPPASAYVEAVDDSAGPPARDYAEARAARVRVSGGGHIMTRGQLDAAKTVDGERTEHYSLPTRVRPRLRVDGGSLALQLEPQVSRALADPFGPARSGMHQAYIEHRSTLRVGERDGEGAELELRVGRQEFVTGTGHVYASAPWAPGMRSWDGLRLRARTRRGGVEVFAASLANPLLSSRLPLSAHVSQSVALTWVVQGHVALAPASERDWVLELGVFGHHTREAGDLRDLYTPTVRIHGALAPGLKLHLEGHLQLGRLEVAGQALVQRAGSAFGKLDYRSPVLGASGDGNGGGDGEHRGPRVRAGAWLGLDYASGGRCTTTDFGPADPCTTGVNRDFHSPWMARHGNFGFGDRFWASNVVDTFVGPKLDVELDGRRGGSGHHLDFSLTEHLFAFADPGGRWAAISGATIGVDPDNRERMAANEVDLRARYRWRWLTLDLGYVLVHTLAGGRKLSGERQRQRVYLAAILNW